MHSLAVTSAFAAALVAMLGTRLWLISRQIRHVAQHRSSVPAAFADAFAIDRAILLGGQAIAQAFAASEHSGMPFFWSEEKGDHGDKMELLIGAILGMSKIRFAVDHGDETQFTDHGVTVLDTAVPIIAARR